MRGHLGWAAVRRRLAATLLPLALNAGAIVGPGGTGPSGPSLPPPTTSTSSGTAPTTATSTATTSTTTTSTTATSTVTTVPVAGPRLPPPNNDRSWTLTFAGDTLLTRRISDDVNPFAGIRPPLADSDLAIVNLETALSTRGRAAVKEFTFRSPPSFADRLNAAGVDVVSLANNHTLDFGPDALGDTRNNLDRAEVAHVGAGASVDEALRPAEFTINGTDVAVLGASQIIPNGSWPATDTRGGVASAGKHVIDRETLRLLAAVRLARTTNDVVAVVLHWGIEGDPCPSAVQRQLARLLRDNGATAVLGAHPHVLQPIVRDPAVPGRTDRDGVIAYSLGNFIWDPRGGATADTGTLELRFDGPAMVAMSFHPHRLNANGWAQAVDPATAAGRSISARVSRPCPGAHGTAAF